jgi:hypothetical protein
MTTPNAPSTTVTEVKTFRTALFDKSMALIDRKGADYNRDQQEAGDTLFNLRVCEILGVVPSTEEGILVRLSDKFMRLISLTKPGREAAVKDESVLDTIADIHNYVDYLGLIWQQRRTVPSTQNVVTTPYLRTVCVRCHQPRGKHAARDLACMDRPSGAPTYFTAPETEA